MSEKLVTYLRTAIRKAVVDDADTLYRIELECFEDEAITKAQLAYFLGSSRFVCLVAKVNHDIAGFIVSSVESRQNTICGHIYSVDVSQRYRRRGIASKLLDEAERIFVEKGAELCFLEVRTDNTAALKLYRKHGYRNMETLKNYYRAGVNGFRLKKEFQP